MYDECIQYTGSEMESETVPRDTDAMKSPVRDHNFPLMMMIDDI